MTNELNRQSNKHRTLPPLTEKEKAVLAFVEDHVAEKGFAPSYQEIKDHFGFASFNSVQNYLKQLMNKGYIEIASNQKRAIQILHSSKAVQESVQKLVQTPREELLLKGREEVLSLPLMGKVAAGRPIEAYTHDEQVDVPPSLIRNPNKTFALQVSGQSMIDDGIHDGDIILVQKQATASNGEIVVATVDNESTVKRFFLRPHPENKEKMVELRPANSTMQSMWFDPNTVQIQGILVGLIRKF
ncbi:MAG: LexA repressor [Oligoflexia bacterium]|nr:MAG: LexA repressor [Oligoflexia bacterium]